MIRLITLSRFVAIITLAIMFSSFRVAAAEEIQRPRVPALIKECEMGDEKYICLTWRWNGSAYEKTGPDGITETISITFDKVRRAHSGVPVTFVRKVESGTASGLVVVYKAELRNGQIEKGKVTWSYMGMEAYGSWSGTYSYEPKESSQPANCTPAGL